MKSPIGSTTNEAARRMHDARKQLFKAITKQDKPVALPGYFYQLLSDSLMDWKILTINHADHWSLP